jgi:hypothetical protein
MCIVDDVGHDDLSRSTIYPTNNGKSAEITQNQDGRLMPKQLWLSAAVSKRRYQKNNWHLRWLP